MKGAEHALHDTEPSSAEAGEGVDFQELSDRVKTDRASLEALGIQGDKLESKLDEFLADRAEDTVFRAEEDGVITPQEEQEIDTDVGEVIVRSVDEFDDGITETPAGKLVEDGLGQEVTTVADKFEDSWEDPWFTREGRPSIRESVGEIIRDRLSRIETAITSRRLHGDKSKDLLRDVTHVISGGASVEQITDDEELATRIVDKLAQSINDRLNPPDDISAEPREREKYKKPTAYNFMEKLPVELVGEIARNQELRERFIARVDIQAYGDEVLRSFNGAVSGSHDLKSDEPELFRRLRQDVELLKDLGYQPFDNNNDVSMLFDGYGRERVEDTQKNLFEIGVIDSSVVDKMYQYKFDKLMVWLGEEYSGAPPAASIWQSLRPTEGNAMANYYRDSSDGDDVMKSVFLRLEKGKGTARGALGYKYKLPHPENFFDGGVPNAACQYYMDFLQNYGTQRRQFGFVANYRCQLEWIYDIIGEPVSPQTTFTSLMEYRRLPKSDAERISQNRVDALTLEGFLWSGHGFIHEEAPGMHELLAATLKVYDAKDDHGKLQQEREKLQQVIDKYNNAGVSRSQLTGNAVGLPYPYVDRLLEDPETELDESIDTMGGFQKRSGNKIHAIDVLRRLVENTTPRDIEKPKVYNENLDKMIQDLHIVEKSDGTKDVEFDDITRVVGKINKILEGSRGKMGFDPSVVEAISFCERLAGVAVKNLSHKEVLEMPFDPGFHELLKFRELALGGEHHRYSIKRAEFGSDSYNRALDDYYSKLTQDIALDHARLLSQYDRYRTEHTQIKQDYVSGLNNALMRMKDML